MTLRPRMRRAVRQLLMNLGLVIGGLLGLGSALQAPTPTARSCRGAIGECVGQRISEAALPFMLETMGGALVGILLAVLIMQSLPALRKRAALTRG